MAGQACADFIAACSSIPGAASRGIEVLNLPLCWERLGHFDGNPDSQEYADHWRSWFFEEIDRLYVDADGRRLPPPVLLDLNPPYHVTRAGKVLCRREFKPGEPEWIQVAESTGIVAFSKYGTEYGDFSNSAPYPFMMDGQMWPSVEDYFQAQKFELAAHREKMREADYPTARRLAQDREQKLRSNWELIKLGVLRAAVWAKFTYYDELRDLLLSTDDAELVDHSEHWDEARDWSDKNLLGRILMDVRSSLRASKVAGELS